jgi:hypothetical protein
LLSEGDTTEALGTEIWRAGAILLLEKPEGGTIRGMQCCYRLRNCYEGARAEHEVLYLLPLPAQAATVLACVGCTLFLLLSCPSYNRRNTTCTRDTSHSGSRCVFACCVVVVVLVLYVIMVMSSFSAVDIANRLRPPLAAAFEYILIPGRFQLPPPPTPCQYEGIWRHRAAF